ncbi:MAG TPA: DUF3310 domain-containing protein [Candidatus Saccharibacteria bacterium]|nr:DUF3310 domain-containing protein [Candidatus Saccharibacteria bacterium]
MNRNIGDCSRWDITFGLEDFNHDPSVDPMAVLIEEITKYLESCGRKPNEMISYYPPLPNTPIEALYCLVRVESTKGFLYTLDSSSKDRLVFKDGWLTGVIVYEKDTADDDFLYSPESPVHKPTEAEDLVDVINHPSHYTSYKGIEVIQLTEQMNFNRGNAVKYITRAGLKSEGTEIEDLEKAKWYIEREINRLKENDD